ncbi:MAG: hypothetical protein ACOCRX_01025 [Candidatus Woesearchaeota archaeon]
MDDKKIQKDKKKILLIEECQKMNRNMSTLIETITDDYNVISATSAKEDYNLFQKEKENLDAVISQTDFKDCKDLGLYDLMKKEKPELSYILTSNKEYNHSKYKPDKFIKRRSQCNCDKNYITMESHEDLKDIVFGSLKEIYKKSNTSN